MFEHIKLNMQLNDMVGFAYEFDDDYTKDGKIKMQVYIVTLKNNEYSFIEYKTYKFFSFEMLYAIADDLEARPLKFYLDLGKQFKKVKN